MNRLNIDEVTGKLTGELGKFFEKYGTAEIEIPAEGIEGLNILGDLEDIIIALLKNPLANMFAGNMDFPEGVKLTQSSNALTEERDRILNQVESHIVNTMTNMVVAKNTTNAISHAFGVDGQYGIASARLWKNYIGKGNFWETWKKAKNASGRIGTFLEKEMFGASDAGSRGDSDYGKISTELKTKTLDAGKLDITVGQLTYNLFMKDLAKDIDDNTEKMLYTISMVIKMILKMRNLFLITYREVPGFNQSGEMTSGKYFGDIKFEKMMLYMVIQIWEVWKAAYDHAFATSNQKTFEKSQYRIFDAKEELDKTTGKLMFPSITVHGNDKIEIKYKFELGAGGKVAPIDDRW